jgi:phage gp36-like protein
MSYVSNEDIERRMGTVAYVQLTDDAGTGSADEAVVDAARGEAEGEVDSYLAHRHRVPIDLAAHPELGPVLASATLELVEYRLHARRPPIPEDVVARFRAALEWLARVADGAVVLPSAGALAGNDAVGIRSRSVGNTARLSHEEFDAL